MTIDMTDVVENAKALWEAYDALGQLIPIDDPSHCLMKRINPDMAKLYVDLLTLQQTFETEIQSAASRATSALFPVSIANA